MPNIVALPHDHQAWRIDWFGNVLYQRQTRHLQPFIRLALSKVTLDTSNDWQYPDRFSPWEEQIHATVPVSMLGLLTIGSIWKDGEQVISPKYEEATFTVTAHSVLTLLNKAGQENQDGSFMIPFEYHPYHREHTHSYCIHAPTAKEIKLVIPATELIRFYFGSSGVLLGKLFRGIFQESNLWSKAEIDAKRRASIELTNGLSGTCASDVARIAFNHRAREAARMITNSLLSKGIDNNEPKYPGMIFPFVGDSKLRVKGIWLGKDDPKSFLAFQILSCSHRFPFANLKYSMAKKQNATGKEHGSGSGPLFQHISGTAQSNTLVNEAPDSRKPARKTTYFSESRFPDLDRKPITRVDPMTPVRVIITESGEIAAGAGVGEGYGRAAIRPLELVAAEEAPIPKGHPLESSDFAKYVDEIVYEQLKKGKQVWFVPMDSRQRFPQFSVMPEIVSEDGEIHPMSFIEIEGIRRPRYISILRVLGIRMFDYKVWMVPEHFPAQGRMEPITCGVQESEVINAEWVAKVIVEQLEHCQQLADITTSPAASQNTSKKVGN